MVSCGREVVILSRDLKNAATPLCTVSEADILLKRKAVRGSDSGEDNAFVKQLQSYIGKGRVAREGSVWCVGCEHVVPCWLLRSLLVGFAGNTPVG